MKWTNEEEGEVECNIEELHDMIVMRRFEHECEQIDKVVPTDDTKLIVHEGSHVSIRTLYAETNKLLAAFSTLDRMFHHNYEVYCTKVEGNSSQSILNVEPES
jgi:hypothetical protein